MPAAVQADRARLLSSRISKGRYALPLDTARIYG